MVYASITSQIGFTCSPVWSGLLMRVGTRSTTTFANALEDVTLIMFIGLKLMSQVPTPKMILTSRPKSKLV